MAIISSDDVGVSLGRPISDQFETEQVNQLIDDAELVIRLRLGALELLDQDALAFVVREAVVSRMRNPEGYASESIDDYTYRLPSESRRLTILPEWWAMLSPKGRAAAFSVMPG